MATSGAALPVLSGHQAWRLLRTDRDGASAVSEIPQMAAAAVRWSLLQGSIDLGAKHELVPVGPNTWRFGPVRPLTVTYVGREEPILGGSVKVLGDRHRSVPGTVPTVRGERPWWVTVEFWWRKPSTTIDYPGFREGIFGKTRELNGADWTLDRAVQLPEAPDPGDQTWDDAMGAAAAQAAREAGAELGRTLATAGGAVGLLALAWLLLRKRNG